MGKIEKLPESSPTATATTTHGPEPAPSVPLDVDALAAELRSTPFFAASSSDLDESSVDVQALRALLDDGTRREVAANSKEQGNECVKMKQWKQAKDLYTQGLAALKAQRKDQAEGGVSGEIEVEREQRVVDLDEEEREEGKLKEALLVNRALANLELQNYRSATLDCLEALKINPYNIKAYYRQSLALLSVSRYLEAEKTTTAGLSIDPNNVALKSLSTKVQQAKEAAQKIVAEQQKAEKRKKDEVGYLRAALAARQISVRTTSTPPDLEDAVIRLVPDPLSPKSTLVFPALLFYPLHAQTDFVKAFGEAQTLAGHFEYLFPLPWDRNGEYLKDRVHAYVETKVGGLVKWGKNVPLLKVIGNGKVEVVDQVVRVNLVPKARDAEFIEKFKKDKSGNRKTVH